MSQQMVNGSHYDGSVTVTNRMSKDYAVVNPPFEGKHRKTEAQMARRHAFNVRINQCLSCEVKAYLRDIYRNSNVGTRAAEYHYMVMKHKQYCNSAYGRMVQNAH